MVALNKAIQIIVMTVWKSSNHWMYGEKPIYILYDKEHYTFCDKGVSDGVSLNVVRDKAGNIEKLVSVDKGELEQFVK